MGAGSQLAVAKIAFEMRKRWFGHVSICYHLFETLG